MTNRAASSDFAASILIFMVNYVKVVKMCTFEKTISSGLYKIIGLNCWFPYNHGLYPAGC